MAMISTVFPISGYALLVRKVYLMPWQSRLPRGLAEYRAPFNRPLMPRHAPVQGRLRTDSAVQKPATLWRRIVPLTVPIDKPPALLGDP